MRAGFGLTEYKEVYIKSVTDATSHPSIGAFILKSVCIADRHKAIKAVVDLLWAPGMGKDCRE